MAVTEKFCKITYWGHGIKMKGCKASREWKYVIILLSVIVVLLVMGNVVKRLDRMQPVGSPSIRFPYDQETYERYMYNFDVDYDIFITADILHDRFGDIDGFGFCYDISGMNGAPLPEDYLNTYSYIYALQCSTHGKHRIKLEIQDNLTGSSNLLEEYVGSHGGSEIFNIDNPNDLRHSRNAGLYHLGVMGYYYDHNGVLEAILWTSENYGFTLSCDAEYMSTCSQNDSGFFVQLLSAETAEKAVIDFNRDIGRRVFMGRIYRNCLPWIVPGVIVVSAAATFLLIRRRRKKKATVAVLLEETQTEKEEYHTKEK